MGNFFKDVAGNALAMEKKLLGPNYPYYKYVKTPNELGMSARGSMSALTNDTIGLINYTELLIAGSGRASKTGKPLGNRFFLKTGATCKSKSGKIVDRYTYFDNIPDGSVPFSGVSFDTFKGLVPGIMNNIAQMNPLTLFSGFMEGGAPSCSEICMSTVNEKNVKGSKCRYVINNEIKAINPCSFSNKKNSLTGKRCKSGFIGGRDFLSEYNAKNLKDKPFANIYIFGFSLFLLYMIIKLNSKK